MALSTQPYKGARDFYPEDKRRQKYMFRKLREAVERYGYEEYDAPILESLDLYLAKTGEEIVNEQTYVFEDRGGRKVVIRPEMTPSVSRLVAGRRQELAYPLRWYSIPNLWRYERPQRGRLREHWQLNVDMFGVADTRAEFEIISLTDHIFKTFGAKHDMYDIRLNHRQLMNYLLHDYLALDETEAHSVGKLIDRMHKMERAAFAAKVDMVLSPGQRDAGLTEKLLALLSVTRWEDLPDVVRQQPVALELHALLDKLAAAGISNVRFDITLMRGFDYYTGIVFEVFDTHPDNNRSMLGGGRYDGLVGLFGVEPVPTVGFGWGDVTLMQFLELHALIPHLWSETNVGVVYAGDVGADAQKILARLREMGANVAEDLSGRRLGDQLKAAEKRGVHYVLIIGETELAEQQFTLRNMQTGHEEKHGLDRIVSIVRDHRDKADDE